MSAAAAASFSIPVATNSLKNVTLSSISPLQSTISVAFPSRGRNTLQRRLVLVSYNARDRYPPTILIAEKLDEAGVNVLEHFANVERSYNMTPKELNTKIPLCDALIVKSETKVGRDVFESSRGRLKVVGRACPGMDNVDVRAVTEYGCQVVNALTANTIASAEHTIALMTSMARNVGQADASVKAGEWKRNKYVGVSLVGKTLAVLGFGKVGTEVARRAKGLGMHVIAHDPYVLDDHAQAIGVDLVSLNKALATADFISLHIPEVGRSFFILDDDNFAKMKKGVRIVNVGRKEFIHEAALVRALDSGIVAHAALDVFNEEHNNLVQHERVTVTPNLGDNTIEAQEGVSTEIAEAVIKALKRGEFVANAVNAPMAAEVPTELKPYVKLAEILGSLLMQQLAKANGEKNVKITYASARANDDLDTRLLRTMIIKGFIESISSDVYVNLINVDVIAKQRGLILSEEHVLLDGSPKNPLETITIQMDNVESTHGGEVEVKGKVKNGVPYLIKIGPYNIGISCTL